MPSPFRALAVCLVTLLASACNRPATTTQSTDDWSADEAAIRQALEESASAFNRGDLPGHLAIYDPGVTFMTSDGPRPGVEPLEQSFRTTYFRDGQPIQPLRFERLATRPLGPDVALSTGRFVLSGGNRPDQSGWFTLVWQRTPSGWRAVHDHSSD